MNNNPIFTLTIAVTGTNLVIDTSNLNVLQSSVDGEPEATKLLTNIEQALRDTYSTVTPLMKEMLQLIYGATIDESKLRTTSESTIFYTKEDDYADN